MENDSRPIYACEICHHILDFDPRTNRYVHTASAPRDGHLVAAVPMETLGYVLVVCDFCGYHVADGEIWTLPCTTFEMPSLPGDRIRMSVGDWAGCPICTEMITNDQWGMLMNRVLTTHHFDKDHPAKPWLMELHSRIRQNVTGQPYLEPATEPSK